MDAQQIINSLTKLIKEHGNLPVYTSSSDPYIDDEQESAGIRFYKQTEVDPDEELYLPDRFFIKN